MNNTSMAERGAVKMASRAEPEGGDSTQIKLPCTLRSKVTQSQSVNSRNLPPVGNVGIM